MFATSNLGDRKNEKPEKDSTKVNSDPGGERDQVRSCGHDDVKEDDGRAVGLVKEEAFNAELHAGRSLLDEGAISMPAERCEDSTAPDFQSSGELGISNLFSKMNLLSNNSLELSSSAEFTSRSLKPVLLPEELVLYVYKFLTPADILSSSQSCQLWREMGENDKLWEKKCKEVGLANLLNSADLRGLDRCREISEIDYSASKLNFRKKYIVAKKFRTGVPQELSVELTYEIDMLKISNDKIVYCPAGFPANQTLYVYSLLDGELLYELVGHTGQVKAIQMNESFVVSGSMDRSVKVWDVGTGFCLHTLPGYNGDVNCLKMHGHIAVFGSDDGTLRMWDLLEGTCRRVITGFFQRYVWGVWGVQYDGKLVVSASFYDLIKVWDGATGGCLRRLGQTPFSRGLLKFNGVNVVEIYSEGSIKVWQVDTGVCSYTLTESYLRDVKLRGDMLVILLRNGPVQIRRASTGAILHTLPAEDNDPYRSMDINDRFVVTGSEWGTIKLWDIKTGELIRVLVEKKDGLGSMWMTENRIMYGVCSGYDPEGARPTKDRLVVLNFDTNDEDYDMGHV